MFKRNVAYHEAGHAVAAHALGMPVISVEVYTRHGVKHEGVGGCTHMFEEDTTNRQLLIYLFAGPLAEARHSKRGLIEVMFRGLDDPASDLGQVQTVLKTIPTYHRDDYSNHIEKQARQLVDTCWSEIKALAERLVSEGVVRFCADPAP